VGEYVWWFLIVGLVVGGALVAAISIDWSRRDEDIQADERDAEATVVAAQLAADDQPIGRTAVAAVLKAHRDYRRLPPPDRLVRLHDDGAEGPIGGEPAVAPEREVVAEPEVAAASDEAPYPPTDTPMTRPTR
jgi:hypothetical protein